ncbi:MAG: hypothetical protein AAF515_21435 [Pseudomonadota bacterium]
MTQQHDSGASRAPGRAARREDAADPSAGRPDAGADALAKLRELLTDERIEEARGSLRGVESRSREGILGVRRELLERLRQTLRALDLVNQSIRDTQRSRADAFEAELAALDDRLEDRAAFLEAKIYTVVADVERRITAQVAAQFDELSAALDDTRAAFDARSGALQARVVRELDDAGARVADRARAIDSALHDQADARDAKLDRRLESLQDRVLLQVEELHGTLDASMGGIADEIALQTARATAGRGERAATAHAELRLEARALRNRLVDGGELASALRELGARVSEDGRAGEQDGTG